MHKLFKNFTNSTEKRNRSKFDGSSFFKIWVTFANFQRLGILPLAREKSRKEKLKSSHNGNDNEWDNSLSSLLLI